MVCPHRHSRHLYSVFSCARPAARAGARDDARGGRGNTGVVHEINATRSGTRLQLCVSASAQEEVAADFRTHVPRGDADYLPAASIQSQLRHAS